MDLSSEDRNGLTTTTNFDMEILTSMANTDLLIRLIKDQSEETSMLKSQLSSFNASAMQMKNCYTAEKKKNDQIEAENRNLQSRLNSLEEKIGLLNNNLLNNTSIHEQTVAEFENQITEKALICRQLINQGNILKANNLSSKEIQSNCNHAREWLKKRGEIVDDVKISGKKKVNVATMTEAKQFDPEKVKTFCNKSTMYSLRKSTATRGTSTSTMIEKVDVATNYPEPLQVEEILSLMIDDMPSLITPISELPLISTSTQTESPAPSSCSIGSVTRIKNVRRRITYTPEQSESTIDSFYRVKKEKEDNSSDSMSNLEYPQNQRTLPINQKLTDLWQMVGQMIFSIIGNGEVFTHTSNLNLINDNLNQIRRVIEMQSQTDDMLEFDGDRDRGFNTDINVPEPVFASLKAGSNNNSTVTSYSTVDPPDVHNFESSTNTTPNISPIVPTQIRQESLENSRASLCTNSPRNVPRCLQFTTKSSVQSETDVIFKMPTTGTKRKAKSESCIRKRTCPTKITLKPVASQLDNPNEKETFQIEKISAIVDPVAPIEQLPSFSDYDSALVQDILKYFKMPELIQPIIDPDFIIEANKQFAEVDECTPNEDVDFEVLSTEAYNKITAADELNEKVDSGELLTEANNKITAADELNEKVDSGMPLPEFPLSECTTHDEFESPASPPPFNDSTTPYRPPSIIPLSPKKLNSSVVKSLLAEYDTNKRRIVSQRKYVTLTEEEERILAVTRNRIEKYITSEWTVNEIDACCNDLCDTRPSILSKSIIEIIMNTKYENLSEECTPPAPALPKTHQKIIVLIKRISRHINNFEDLVLFQLEKVLFVLAGELVSINEAMNLTRLFIGLSDSMDQESTWSCVLFIYKCLYYFSFKALPMVYTVLMAYPAILPKFQEGDDIANFLMTTTNILQATFMIVLINTNLFESADAVLLNNGLKKKELSSLLKKYYHFPVMKPSTDEFVDYLINRLSSNSTNFQNISYSIILLAKRKGPVWADDVIQRKLLPLLNDYLSTISDGKENDERITTLLSAISSIVKTYPVTKDISNYQQMFNTILNSTTRQIIQETAVMSLLRTSRFGMVDVYRRVCDWQPSFEVDIDEVLLVRNLFKAEPLICDYLREREKQLVLDVYCGSIDTENDCLLNTDVVIGVEIIEHLYPETIENVPYNIFGFMKPKIAIFTTPNSECNVLFNMTEKFRHDDHKFEWTREQFEDWGHNICARFPDYNVAFYGIGPGPSGTEGLGCCSQMALFIRKDFLELTAPNANDKNEDEITSFDYNNQADLPETHQTQRELILDATEFKVKCSQSEDDDGISLTENDVIDDMTIDFATNHIDNKSYRLIKSCVYPRNMDERPQEQKIFDEACFHLARYQNLDDDHYDPIEDIIRVPVEKIFNLVYRYTSDIDEFRDVMLKRNYIINENDDFVIKPIDIDSDGDDDYKDVENSDPIESVVTVRDTGDEEDWD